MIGDESHHPERPQGIYTGKVALMSLHDESSWLLPKSSPLQLPEDRASLVELALPFLTLTLTLTPDELATPAASTVTTAVSNGGNSKRMADTYPYKARRSHFERRCGTARRSARGSRSLAQKGLPLD